MINVTEPEPEYELGLATYQSINQSLFVAVSKYSTTVVNRQSWTGQ